jgi:hypothetical protein
MWLLQRCRERRFPPPLQPRSASLLPPLADLFLSATPTLIVLRCAPNKVDKPRSGVSVPGHALRCGPETSVTGPLRWRWVELRAHEKTYIQSSRPWECGNLEGISTECGKGGKPASWLSTLSILCHFHGLLFTRQMLDKPICGHPVQYAALATRCSSGTRNLKLRLCNHRRRDDSSL